jgi:radical SAM protein with 4Fe4S-binding SPASM domain
VNAAQGLHFAWLEVTGFCNLACDHCYADSSPRGTHGRMTVRDWRNCIDQLAAMGVRDVQFIGGEPTLHPHLGGLVTHACDAGLGVEVFSNLTHVSEDLWSVFARHRVNLATSYYSDRAEDHDAVTGRRGSHARTRVNISRARELGLNVRGGVISVRPGQRVLGAREDLAGLGLTSVGADRARRFGRAARDTRPAVADLCGHCAHGKCAVGPDGGVWPCVLSRFIDVGNVRTTPLAEIWNGPAMTRARAEIQEVHGTADAETRACTPPQFLPMCGPCSPCVPSVTNCDPRAADAPVAAPVAATIGTAGQC